MKVKWQVCSSKFLGEKEKEKNSWTCYFIRLNKVI